jgi:NCAIR mutase (PurE)-related protein
MDVRAILEAVREGRLSVAEAGAQLTDLPYRDLDFAKLDHHRCLRTGFGEVVFCPGKTDRQLEAIVRAFMQAGQAVLGTRCTVQQADFLAACGIRADFDEVSRTLVVRGETGVPPKLPGSVAICTGGTGDLPVAEEAARTAEFFGLRVERCYDVGIAGLHRLLSRLESIRSARVVIAIAGMEGALAGVLAGLVAAPVIAVPTSVGYGASLNGIAPLLTMLNSCAEGVGVVNIDNGFGAAMLACRMCRALAEEA